MKMSKKLLIPAFLIAVMAIGTVYGAFLTYNAYVEIYGYKYPLGQIEIDVDQLPDIEGLEAREDYVGEILVYTYSNDTQLILQLLQVSHIVTNFRCFTIKVCLPLDMVFVVDLTGSMGPYMATVREKLIELMWVIRGMHKCDVQVGVVGFWDETPAPVTCPLTSDLAAVETFIRGLTASGGGPIPQSHHVGFEKALEMFQDKPESWTHDRIVVFVSDAPPGVNNVFEWGGSPPCTDHPGTTQSSVLALVEAGIKVHSVLCGPDQPPESLIYRWYADVTGGHFVPSPERMIPVVTSNPTWIVKLTAVTQFDSFQLPTRSSPPTEKVGYYNFSIYVDFFAKAIPWHEWFSVELAAHLEKAEPKPYFPPPEFPPKPPIEEIEITLGYPVTVAVGENITFNWDIYSPPELVPVRVELKVYNGAEVIVFTGTTFPDDFTGSATWTATEPTGTWTVRLDYDFTYLGDPYTAGADGTFTVTAPE